MPKNEPKSKTVPASAIAKYFQAKLQAEWGPHDVIKHREANPRQVVVLDVRDKDSYAQEHIQGAVNIPLDELPARVKELSKDKDIVPYCWTITCSLAPRAALWLSQRGYKVHELVGGIGTWKKAGMPIESRTETRTPALAN